VRLHYRRIDVVALETLLDRPDVVTIVKRTLDDHVGSAIS